MTDNNSNKVLDYLALQAYVDELVMARKPKIPADQMEKYKESLMSQVMEAINARLVGLLPEAKQLELEKLLNDNADQTQIYTFFETSIPQMEAEITVVLQEFREGYLIDLSAMPNLPPMPIKK